MAWQTMRRGNMQRVGRAQRGIWRQSSSRRASLAPRFRLRRQRRWRPPTAARPRLIQIASESAPSELQGQASLLLLPLLAAAQTSVQAQHKPLPLWLCSQCCAACLSRPVVHLLPTLAGISRCASAWRSAACCACWRPRCLSASTRVGGCSPAAAAGSWSRRACSAAGCTGKHT